MSAMDHEGSEFNHLKKQLGYHKSDVKLSAGSFIGPEIRKLFVDENFPKHLNAKESAA